MLKNDYYRQKTLRQKTSDARLIKHYLRPLWILFVLCSEKTFNTEKKRINRERKKDKRANTFKFPLWRGIKGEDLFNLDFRH